VKTALFSRRVLLAAGAGVSAAPLLNAALREPIALCTQAHGISPEFLRQLVTQFEASFEAAGHARRVVPLVAERPSEVATLARQVRSEALIFAGAGWDATWRAALPGSISFSLGTEADEGAVASPLWQSVELGAAWSAAHLGRRSAVIVGADQCATDLPFAWRCGAETAGGEVSSVVVAHAGRAHEAWSALSGVDHVAVFASGALAAQVWSRAPSGLATVTHCFSGAPEGSFVIGEATPPLVSLATRVVARVLGHEVRSPVISVRTPGGLVDLGAASSATLTLATSKQPRNRSTHPFTGC
jgi:hypothetical protein